MNWEELMNSKLINLFLWVCSVLKMGCLKIPTRTLVLVDGVALSLCKLAVTL